MVKVTVKDKVVKLEGSYVSILIEENVLMARNANLITGVHFVTSLVMGHLIVDEPRERIQSIAEVEKQAVVTDSSITETRIDRMVLTGNE